jgi:nucleoside-diphosphate-sugar epimerase
MLKHLNQTPVAPRRVVVIGAGGFVGKAIVERLRSASVDTAGLTRADVDLLAADASTKIASHLREGDSLVAVSAIAPCKNPEMLRDNVVLAANIVGALAAVPLAHVVNISSDAVFGDEPLPLTETAPRAPESYHGVMHLAREIMFATEVKAPLAILRPTLIYGARDPHNGYGPNQFRRKANKGESIVLFGEGEERRDHIAVEDVAELVARVLMHRSTGSLNVASGTVTSFRDLAELAVKLSGKPVAISGSPRKGPMPHNGYRPFDPAATIAAFPDFKYTTVAGGMVRAQKTEFANG